MPPHQVTGPTTPLAQRRQAITHKRFRLFPVRSPLLGESFLLSFPPGTKMFQFPGLPRQSYGFTLPSRDMTPEGFPHSDSRGSTSVGDSSRTIVASHVLLRLLAPRYPPKALCSLTTLALSFDLILQRSFGLLQMSSALGPLLHPLTNEQIYRFLLCRDLDKRSRRASYAVFKVQKHQGLKKRGVPRNRESILTPSSLPRQAECLARLLRILAAQGGSTAPASTGTSSRMKMSARMVTTQARTMSEGRAISPR